MFLKNKYNCIALFLLVIKILVSGSPVPEPDNDLSQTQRPSMLNMLAKYIEINKTIDNVIAQYTENSRIWLNATRRPHQENYGICPQEEEYTELVEVTEKIPYDVEVEVWCWSATFKCMETETHYREEKKLQNVTRTRTVDACCDGFEFSIDVEKCIPVCSRFCENGGFCTEPEKCECPFGYEGNFCETDSLPAGILTGQNVCERVEEYVDDEFFTENELVQYEEKSWCWKFPPRCSKMVSKTTPIQKVRHVKKTRTVNECCEGYVKNDAGNRCAPNDLQQMVV